MQEMKIRCTSREQPAEAKAADAPVEWDGRDAPVVGERVVISGHATGGDEVSGIIVLPPDSDGDYVIRSDDGVYWTECVNNLRPVQSERDKAISALASDLAIVRNSSIQHMSEYLYGVGWRNPERGNE